LKVQTVIPSKPKEEEGSRFAFVRGATLHFSAGKQALRAIPSAKHISAKRFVVEDGKLL
jgi:hypothetical protein